MVHAIVGLLGTMHNTQAMQVAQTVNTSKTHFCGEMGCIGYRLVSGLQASFACLAAISRQTQPVVKGSSWHKSCTLSCSAGLAGLEGSQDLCCSHDCEPLYHRRAWQNCVPCNTDVSTNLHEHSSGCGIEGGKTYVPPTAIELFIELVGKAVRLYDQHS